MVVGDGYNDISMFMEVDVVIVINFYEGVEGDYNVESFYEVREIIEELIWG